MGDIEHIVLDVGNVLIHWDVEIPFRRLIPDAEQRSWFLTNICTPQWNLEQDRGRNWHDAEAVLIEQYPHEETNIRAFRKYWHEMIEHAVDDTFSILENLVQTGHDVTLLTNFSDDTFPQAVETHPQLALARGVTVSADVGLLKPDPAIYEHHTTAFDLKPQACLFFDDSTKNVDGARNCGWQAEQFTSANLMLADLKRHGISVE